MNQDTRASSPPSKQDSMKQGGTALQMEETKEKNQKKNKVPFSLLVLQKSEKEKPGNKCESQTCYIGHKVNTIKSHNRRTIRR